MGKGIENGQARMELRQLWLKFGELPEALVRRVEEADEAMLMRWPERVLDAARLEDVMN